MNMKPIVIVYKEYKCPYCKRYVTSREELIVPHMEKCECNFNLPCKDCKSCKHSHVYRYKEISPERFGDFALLHRSQLRCNKRLACYSVDDDRQYCPFYEMEEGE